MRHKIYIISGVLCILSLAGLALVQNQIDRINPLRNRLGEKLIYIPSGEFIKTASLGFHVVLADLLWARAVVYFGDHYTTDRDYGWLYDILNAATTLDPNNILAYRFGGSLLAVEANDVERSIELLEKGIRDNPDKDWRLYLLMGFNYFYYLEDYATAAEYLEKASRIPGHPEFLTGLTAKMYSQAGKIDTAIDFLEEMYEQYEDENVKSAIANRINDLKERR